MKQVHEIASGCSSATNRAGQADFTSRSAVSGARRRTAKAEFKAAWEALKARITPEQLAAAYMAVNIRDAD